MYDTNDRTDALHAAHTMYDVTRAIYRGSTAADLLDALKNADDAIADVRPQTDPLEDAIADARRAVDTVDPDQPTPADADRIRTAARNLRNAARLP